MKKMKRNAIFFGAVVTALLMISTATAVEQVNNKPVMNAIEIEKTQQDMINELLAIWDDLVESNPIVAWFQDTFDINAEEDIQNLFDFQGLVNHMISDEFINLLNNNLDELLEVEIFQAIYETDSMQEYLESDEFIEFTQTDEIQYLLSQLDGESNGSSESYKVFMQQNQDLLGVIEGFYGVSPDDPLNVELPSDGTTYKEAIDNEEQTTYYSPFWVVLLIIGLITWAPAAVLIVLCTPLLWAYIFIAWLPSLYIWFPGELVAIAMLSFFIAVGIAIFLILAWPGIIAGGFGVVGYTLSL